MDDIVIVPDSDSLDVSAALTLSFWVKLNALPAGIWQNVVRKNGSYVVEITGGGNVRMNTWAGENWQTGFAEGGALEPGVWYFMAGVKLPGAGLQAYINGELIAEGDKAGDVDITTNALHIGAGGPAWMPAVNGTIKTADYRELITELPLLMEGFPMFASIILSDGWQLCIDGVGSEEGVIVIRVSSTSLAGQCPCCQAISERIHSSYQRHPADLPIVGYTVRLDIDVRRFFCDNDGCQRTIFAERMPSLVVPYARRTNRLAHQQQKAAFALGGEAGAALLAIMGMAVSPDTLLRLIRKAPEPEMGTPRVLGVDDWAKRKGQSYGTILVDLEAHRPVDLLPDRSAESFAKWLKEHPGVEIISRDRGVEYIKGANEGAPDAIQVADRWHLLKNLRDALKKMLETRRACLNAAADKTAQDVVEQKNKDTIRATEESADTAQKLTKAEKQKLERQTRRQERYETMKELYQHGLSKSEITRRLGLDWKTVAKYINSDECPTYTERRKRPGKLSSYVDYMTKRWDEGCHNATQIWHEIRELGFDGARRTVGDWASRKRKSTSGPDLAPEKIIPWSASRAAWLMAKQEEKLTKEDRQALERMKQADEKVAEAYILGQRFAGMVRERQHESLLPWLEDVAKSKISALTGFANGIKQDLTAVTNALSLPWSNGQTEGQVNRLKLIKRQMYGRANFDLLRRRVIGGPALWNPD